MIEINESIFQELELLVMSFVLGVVLMILYDIIRLFRMVKRQGAVAVAVEDLLFWAVASVAIFGLLFLLNEGNIRFYALASTMGGMIIYYRTIGKIWPKALRKQLQKRKKS